MDPERLQTDLSGLVACALKVRWQPEAAARAQQLCAELSTSRELEAIRAALASLKELAEQPESVRLSFSEQRQADPHSSGRELLLFLLSLVRRSLTS